MPCSGGILKTQCAVLNHHLVTRNQGTQVSLDHRALVASPVGLNLGLDDMAWIPREAVVPSFLVR